MEKIFLVIQEPKSYKMDYLRARMQFVSANSAREAIALSEAVSLDSDYKKPRAIECSPGSTFFI